MKKLRPIIIKPIRSEQKCLPGGRGTGQRQHVDTEGERERETQREGRRERERGRVWKHKPRDGEGRWRGKERGKTQCSPRLMTSSVFLSSAVSPFLDRLLSPWCTTSIHTHRAPPPILPFPILCVTAKQRYPHSIHGSFAWG